MLSPASVLLGQTAASREDAIDQVGRMLFELGAVEEEYIAAMHEREKSVSTFLGEGVAIPHGTDKARKYVKRTGLAVLQFPAGVAWGANEVHLCVGIADRGCEQIDILSSLARILMDAEQARVLREAPDVDTILRLLNSVDEETVQ
jgi:mannitol/fructose-specific phosphotransferase system IIA component